MPKSDIIVVGASVGGVEALRTLAAGLPENLPAAVFFVLHVWPEGKSMLPQILDSVGPLPARHPVDGEPIRTGTIYIAPPDYHMTLRTDSILLRRGPKENRHRPAIDPLFRSAAAAFGPRVAGVVLTGYMDDGSAGLLAIKRRGGKTIVQDPNEAVAPEMPANAMAAVNVDYAVGIEEIPRVLAHLATREHPARRVATGSAADIIQEERVAEAEMDAIENGDRPGNPSVYTCPDCHGTLWELQDGDLLRFRCRVGHAYTADNLVIEQDESLERALWAALRALEESSSLHRRMAERAQEKQQTRVAQTYEDRAVEQESSAEAIRDILLKMG